VETESNNEPSQEGVLNSGDAKLRERTQLRNAAREAMADAERERQAPRLRVKAKAEHAAKVTAEALGVHEKLPDHQLFNQLSEARAKIAQSVQATFGQISQALTNPTLDGTRSVMQVADLGRESLARHIAQVDAHRERLQAISESIEDRRQKAMQAPPHLAGMMPSARDALRAMSAEDRSNLISKAKGDAAEVIMYAVGGAPAFVSGVAEGKQLEMRMSLFGVRDPDLLVLEPGIRQAFAALDKMQAGITRLIGDVADFDTAKALAALRAGSGKG